MSGLQVEELSAGYGRSAVLNSISFRIDEGDFVGILGQNGSGKSTLLKCIGRLHKQYVGRVLLDGSPLSEMPRRSIARKMAVLPQHPVAPPEVTVRELVGYGRYPHSSWLKRWDRRDRDAIESALEACRLRDLAERKLSTLSGGERQRAWIAMTLAQQSGVLLLDEPISSLDIGYQLETLDLIARFNREQGLTVLMVVHDINLAARYCGKILLIRNGMIYAQGAATDALNPDTIKGAFDVDAQRISEIASGRFAWHFSRTNPGFESSSATR